MQADVRLEPLAAADPLALPTLLGELERRWLVFDAFTGGKRRVDLHPLVLSPGQHRAAVRVAEGAARLVFEAGDRAAADPAEAARYRLHPDVERLAAASRRAGDLTTLARVDLLLRDDGAWVACEVNADCPGGHNEALALPHLARLAGHRGAVPSDPHLAAHLLADRLVALSGGPGSPRGLVALLYATAYAEDLQICALVERLVVERGGRAVRAAATALAGRVGSPPAEGDARAGTRAETEQPIVTIRGERVAVAYRFYPTEYMAGQANIPAIVAALEAKTLSSVASFASIHAQSKLAMARAFAHDPSAAGAFFAATSAFADVPRAELLRDRERWVCKRDLSRVGDHVVVGAATAAADFAEALEAIAEVEAEGEPWIAQRFVPQRPIATPWGDRWLTLGAYVFEGRFAGYFARLASDATCSHDALVVPVFV